jgi:hypothetical protein
LVLNFIKTSIKNENETFPNLFKKSSSFLNYSALKNDKDACKKLDSFIAQVIADNNLKFSQKIQLLDSANDIKARIGCSK